MFRLCDGFDSYAASDDMQRRWRWFVPSQGIWQATGGRLGGGCYFQAGSNDAGNNTGIVYRPLPAIPLTNVTCIAYWVKIASIPPAPMNQAYTICRGGTVAGGVGVDEFGMLCPI